MTENPTFKWEETLAGEVLLLGLVGRLFYMYPGADEREWLCSLLFEDGIFSEVPFAAHRKETDRGLRLLQQWKGHNLTDEEFETIQIDYTRLFIGPKKVLAPPWESVYFTEERLVFQEQTLQVRHWYRRFGLEPERLYKEPDDHIGLEMSFVSYLAKLALQALNEQDLEKFTQLLEAKRQFLADHLLRWGPYWCTLVSEHARTDFYKGLALLTQGALLTLAEQYGIETSKEVVR